MEKINKKKFDVFVSMFSLSVHHLNPIPFVAQLLSWPQLSLDNIPREAIDVYYYLRIFFYLFLLPFLDNQMLMPTKSVAAMPPYTVFK